MMQAGSAANQIPGEAVMRGTMRTLRNAVRDQIEAAVHRVAAGVAHTFDVEDRRGACPRQSGDAEHAGGTRPRGRGGEAGRPSIAARHGAGDDR